MKLKKIKKLKGDSSDVAPNAEDLADNILESIGSANKEEGKEPQGEKKEIPQAPPTPTDAQSIDAKEAQKGEKSSIADAISDDILGMIESSDAPAKEPEGKMVIYDDEDLECPECGEKLPAGSRSCLNCGALLEIEEIEVPVDGQVETKTDEAKRTETNPVESAEDHIDITAPVQQLIVPAVAQKPVEDEKDRKNREKLRWMIDECKKRGYDVSSIEPSLETQEIISLSKRVVAFLGAVRMLGEIEADFESNISSGKFDPNDAVVNKLRSKLKDPALIEEVKAEYTAVLSEANAPKHKVPEKAAEPRPQLAEVPAIPETKKIELVELEELPKGEEVSGDIKPAEPMKPKEAPKEIPKTKEVPKEIPKTKEVPKEIPKTKEVPKEIPKTKEVPKEIPKPREKPREVAVAEGAAEAIAEEEEKFACPFCGTAVSSRDAKCSHCHAEFEDEQYQCGYCGARIEKNARECVSCGGYLGDDESICPVCDQVISSSTQRCPRCGAEFLKNAFSCASCGAQIFEPNLTNCPSCGVVLKEEVTVTQGPEGTVIINAGDGKGRKGKDEKKDASSEDVEPGSDQRTARVLFPFSAIVAQENMKLALMLNAINPDIGGVLIEGEKGTAKSITVRGLAEILPPITVIKGCRFSCDPAEPEKYCWECRVKYKEKGIEPPVETRPIKVVDLPLNATEDRVVGTIDLEKILTQGLRAFEHGILAEANRGILYIDEINLLDDYVVDVLLDAAAMGVCTVERESVSVSYPAKFIIVGSMNPEEGALRPQLLDRIALQVKIKGVQNVEDRIEIVKRREEFNREPDNFRSKFEPQQEDLKQKIIKARALLPKVSISREILQTIAKVSVAFGVDGHRADIIMERSAKAYCALQGRLTVTLDDVMKAAEYALPHRMRKRPFEEEEFSLDKLKRVIEQNR